jgi:hypothetical protein
MNVFKKIGIYISKRSTWRKIIFILVLIAPVLCYSIRFRKYPISDNPSDWADFGSYIGGIYTLLVTFLAIYLTRHLERRDIEWKKSKTAVGELYEQISRIDYKNVDMRSVSKLLRLVKQYQLYIPVDVYDNLVSLRDDYVEAKTEPEKFDIKKEQQIKSRLKKLYDS